MLGGQAGEGLSLHWRQRRRLLQPQQASGSVQDCLQGQRSCYGHFGRPGGQAPFFAACTCFKGQSACMPSDAALTDALANDVMSS